VPVGPRRSPTSAPLPAHERVLVDGAPVQLGPDEVVVTETPRSGWAVAADGGETVALDLTVTPELHRAGLAREVVRLVQDARKAAGLDVSDRILLRWAASGETAEALREHARLVADEVLATSYAPGEPDGPGWAEQEDRGVGLRWWLRKA
jgi:isoleucyl-tRNA synthetase